MQYLIKVSGNVTDFQTKTYLINSKNSDLAQADAADRFRNEFCTNYSTIYVKPQKRSGKAIAAIFFMLIPIFLSFINWKIGHETVSISPDYLSCIYAVAFYSVFVIRFKGIQRTASSVIDLIFCVVVVLLLSGFIKTLLVSKTFSIFGLAEFTVNTSVVLPVALLLSALGLKVVSLICLGGIAVFALFNITSLNIAMGNLWGTVYVISSFLGIILYLSVEPVAVESIFQIKNTLGKAASRLSSDINISKEQITTAKVNITQKISENKKGE